MELNQNELLAVGTFTKSSDTFTGVRLEKAGFIVRFSTSGLHFTKDLVTSDNTIPYYGSVGKSGDIKLFSNKIFSDHYYIIHTKGTILSGMIYGIINHIVIVAVVLLTMITFRIKKLKVQITQLEKEDFTI